MDRETRPGGLTPIGMVAEEMSISSSLSYEEILSALQGVLLLLMGRAIDSLDQQPGSIESLERCREYLATSEAIVAFGTTLRALEDIERHELRRAG